MAMKNFTRFAVILIVFFSFQFAQAQNADSRGFELTGKNPEVVQMNQTFTKTTEVSPFSGKATSIYGLAVKASISFSDENGLVRIILVDQQNNEYLVYEAYPMLEDETTFSVENLCEETAALNNVTPRLLKIEVKGASLSVKSITYTTVADKNIDIQKVSKEKKNLQNSKKISQINKSIKSKGLAWVAGETEVSALSYGEKKKLFGQSTFPSGIEYYTGGILQAGDGLNLKSATAAAMVDNWDWRSRHSKNWVTEVKNQGSCGSCWAFAATGATEAQVNLYYNQLLNLNLSEQDVLSCSGGGDCSGGFPDMALDYIKNNGIVDETAFPYTSTNQLCSSKNTNSTQLIKIGGRANFGSTTWPKSDDNLKKMIIKYGPLSGGLYDWSHAMVLLGWKVVKAGDRFYTRDSNKMTYWVTIPDGSPLIGTTVWIFKNSWGNWGDGGYVYVQTTMANIGWTHGITSPVQSLKQNYAVQYVDNDHDGYYWWGLGVKPASCPGPDQPDGDDSNVSLGPLDEFGNCTILGTLPAVNFTADKLSISTGAQVKLTDQTTNNPTSWAWTLSGATQISSTLQNPVITFTTAGVYSVTLKATNASGDGTSTKANYITVTAPQLPLPVAGFTADKTSVISGDQVRYTDSSTNSPTSWAWTFPGGTPGTSTLQNPTVIYSSAGVYSVTLKATNASGDGTLTKTGYITVTAPQLPLPVAGFTADKTSVTTGDQVRFTDSTTNNPTAWLWTITGAAQISSSLQNPAISFSAAGVYSVTLKATNASGDGTLTKTNYITVSNPLPPVPVSEFTADKTSIDEGQAVNFVDLSTNNPVSWSWSIPGGNPSSSTLKNPSVTYKTAGKYNVTLVVTNAGGNSTKIKTEYVIVNASTPVTYSNSNGNASKEWISQVSLNGTSFTSNSSGTVGYADLTSNIFNVTANNSYLMSLTPKSIGKANYWYWSVWIDFNHDFDFNDAGEQVLISGKSKSNVSKSIVIPSTSLVGATRMRVSMKRDALPLSNEVFAYGEVKDFTVNISAPAASGIQSKIADNEMPLIINSGLSLAVFPNPTERIVNLKLDEIFGNEIYSIYNLQGAMVRNARIESNITQVDVTGLPAGIYIVKVKNGEQSFQEKFIKR